MAKTNKPIFSTSSPNSNHTTNPFLDSLDTLRVPSSFDANPPSIEVFTALPVRKPKAHEFFRICPGSSMGAEASVYFDETDFQRCYFVAPEMCELLKEDTQAVRLRLASNLEGSCFLWPLKLPANDRPFPWYDTALTAAAHAEKHWVRMKADLSMGGYRIRQAVGNLPDPTWPEATFEELCSSAFADQTISTEDHPIVRALWGA